MELRRLRYFARVATEGSLGAASRALRIAQPALSRQMQLLESELGVPLFVRVAKGMRLTEEGEYLRDALSHPLQQLDVAFQNVQNFSTRVEATCTLGLPPLLAQNIGSRLVKRLARDLPNVKLRLVVEDSARLNGELLRGTVDLAILVGLAPDDRLFHGEILKEDLLLVGSPTSAIGGKQSVAFSELEHYNLVLPSHPASIPIQLEKISARQAVRLHVAIEVDSEDVIIDLIKGGDYYSILPEIAVKSNLTNGDLAAVKITSPDVIQIAHFAAQKQWRIPRSVYNQFHRLFYDEISCSVIKRDWPATLAFDPEAMNRDMA